MSVELLDDLKQKARELSPQEIETFVVYLHGIKSGDKKDLGLAGENKAELRELHKQWLKANREKYAGQYVALVGAKVIGVGKTRPEAVRQAKNSSVPNAFITYVYPLDYVGEIGGW
jgi:hypothetical protein